MTLGALPRYSTLRTRQALSAARDLPAVALAARTVPGTDVTTAAALLRRPVALTLLVHPTLERLLAAAAERVDGHTYVIPSPVDRATAHMVEVLAAAHPSLWSPPTGVRLPDILGEELHAAAAAAGLHLGQPRPKRLAHTSLKVQRRGRKLHITPSASARLWASLLGLDEPARAARGTSASTGGVGPSAAVSASQAVHVIRRARAHGLVALDADQPGRLADLHWTAQRSVVVSPVPDAPGWAVVTAGPLTSTPAAGVMPAGAATAAVTSNRAPLSVATHPDVAAAAAVEQAAGTGRERLHPWQDRFVSAYAAANRGLVNALEPGMGKTVCAAAALTQMAEARPRYRAVVIAPPGLHTQWANELASFFPAARVRPLRGGGELRNPSPPAPEVLLASPEMLARHADHLDAAALDDLVVDEATFLANPSSARSRAVWTLRSRASRAMALTGTPDTRRLDDLGPLVAFALNDPSLFTATAVTAPHPDGVPAGPERVGPYLFTAGKEARAALPAVTTPPQPIAPSELEQQIDTMARERVADLLAQAKAGSRRATATALQTEITAWRLGLCSPAGLLASKYALAQQLRAALPRDVVTSSSKLAWARAETAAKVDSAEQILLFSDFLPAIDELAVLLRSDGFRVGTLTSASGAGARDRLVRQFVAGHLDALLVSATGQLGLNLQTAASVVHLDVPTSAGVLRQRTARAARLGSRSALVTANVPVLRGCADEALLRRIQLPKAATDLWELAAHL